MVIRDKLRELYNSYKSFNPNEHFIPCGVVNEEAYKASCPKLVCIFKEPNDPDQHPEWRLDTFLEKQVKKGTIGQPIYPMWRVVGIWSYSIHNGFPKYGDINTVQISAQGLNCIGMTNLKKSGGGGTSNYHDILEYAKKTVSLWKSGLETMSPDMILCGGTFRIVTDLLGLQKNRQRLGYFTQSGNTMVRTPYYFRFTIRHPGLEKICCTHS